MPDLLLMLALLLALVPAIVQLSSGHAIVRHREDPALPELMFARARRLGSVTAVCVVAMLMIRPGHAWWLFPLSLVALMSAAYPVRRALYGDLWGFATYFRYSLFSGIAVLGFWLLLAQSPGAILGIADGRAGVALGAGLVLAALLLLHNRHYTRLWIALHRAEPVADPELARRFEEMAARAATPRVEVWQVGPRGSRILNAMALASAGSPSVAMGRAVVEEFTPEESCAIFAHELAHLEHYSGARLRWMQLVSTAMILGATLLPAATLAIVPAWSQWLPLLLLAAVMAVIIRRSSTSQAEETASDLRAVELCGSADALISALTKLHVKSHLPRQWPHEFETGASHPSLARRIAAISERAKVAAVTPAGTTLVHGLLDGVRILLDENRLHWFEGVPETTPDGSAAMRDAASSYRAIAYDDLIELRVVARGESRSLRAVRRSGEQLSTPISSVDAAVLKRALDLVDVRLGRPAKAESTGTMQLLASGLAIALLAGSQIGLPLLLALLVLFRPRLGALAAMGAIALVYGAIGLAAAAGEISSGAGLALVLIPLIGAVAIAVALSGVRAANFRRTRSPLALLLPVAAACALLLVAVALRDGAESLLTHPRSATLLLALLGLGGACLAMDSRRLRRSGAGLGGVAAAASLLLAYGSAGNGRPTYDVEEARLTQLADLPIDGMPFQLELSPGGTSYAHRRGGGWGEGDEFESPGMIPMTIGRVGEETRELLITDAAFLDDSTMLIVAHAGDSLELRLEGLGRDDLRGWRERLPGLAMSELLFDAGSGRWTVLGQRVDGLMFAYSGAIGAAGFRETQWGSAGAPATEHALYAPDDESLVVASFGSGSTADIVLSLLGGRSVSTRLSRRAGDRVEPLGTVPGYPSCRSADGGALCVIESGGTTQFWRAHGPEAPTLSGTLPRGYAVRNLPRSGAIAALSRDGSSVVLVGVSGTSALRVTLPDEHAASRILEVQTAGDVLAVLRVTDGMSARLTAYQVHYPVLVPPEALARTARHTK